MTRGTEHLVRSVSLHERKQLYPVVDEQGCAPRFTSKEDYPLWTMEHGTNAVAINALEAAQDLRLSVCVEIPETQDGFQDVSAWVKEVSDKGVPTLEDIQQGHRSGFQVEMLFYDSLGVQSSATSTELIDVETHDLVNPKMTYYFRGVDLKHLVSPERAQDEPWAYFRSIGFNIRRWEKVGSKTGYYISNPGPYNAPHPTIEIYAICPALPRFLRHEGIPRTLLRFALSSLDGSLTIDSRFPYSKAITNRVFNSGFAYERNGGSYAFTDGAGRTFELNKFLRLWTALRCAASPETQKLFQLRYQGNKPTVNCYDQTGILGLCMSFACKDEYDRDTLLAYFMRPYGFLRATPLVGHGICNNPFYTYSQVLVVDDTSESRTKFGNHVFLSFRGKIYDACAGPVVGEPLTDYVHNAIDAKEGHYPHQFWVTPKNESPQLESPSKDEFTGEWYNARPYQPSDSHGGIMGELDRMMHSGSYTSIPPDVNRELENKEFSLDILSLGKWLMTNTADWDHKVTSEESRTTHTGVDHITKDSARQGEIIWALKVNETSLLTLSLRVCESFGRALAERSAMYGDGKIEGQPSAQDLMQDRCVSAKKINAALNAPPTVHATALAGRFILDGQSTSLTQDVVEALVRKAMEHALAEKEKLYPLIVKDKAADGIDPDHGTIDESRHHVIQTEVGKPSSYVIQVSNHRPSIKTACRRRLRLLTTIQVRNCLDIDWCYKFGVRPTHSPSTSPTNAFRSPSSSRITRRVPTRARRKATSQPPKRRKIRKFSATCIASISLL